MPCPQTGWNNCRAKALKDSIFCFFHEPACVEKRKAAQRTGGRNRTREIRLLPPDTADRHLSTRREISTLLDDLLNGLLKGQLDPLIVREGTRLLLVRLRLSESSKENDPGVDAIIQKLNEGRLRRIPPSTP